MDLWDEVGVALNEVNKVLGNLFLVFKWYHDINFILLAKPVLHWTFLPLKICHVDILDLPVKDRSDVILLLLEVLLMF